VHGDDGFGGFDGFVRDHAPALLRTAVLLTGDRRTGEGLVVAALVRARGRWRTVATADDPAATVRGMLVERHLRRPFLGGGQVLESLPDPGERTAALREALSRLDPVQRTALVLRHLDGLPEPEVARLLHRPAQAVRDDLARARAALPRGADDVEEQLAALADELTWPDPTVPPEAVTDRRRRQRRTRAGLVAAAVALAGVLGAGVPAAAGWLGPPPAERTAAGPAPAAGRQPADVLSAAEAEEARQAARPHLEAAVAGLGEPLVLTSPAGWDQWLPEGRPAAGSTGQEDEDTCPPLSGRLSADLGLPMGYWTGALPRGPVGCTWVPGPVPLSQGGPYDYAQVVSVGFVAGSAGPATIEELRTALLPGAGRGPVPCPATDVPGGGALISCTGPTGGYEAPLVLAVPDARGAGVWVLSATVEWGAERSTAEVLAVLVEAVRPLYG
jgi:DNA-directed RNA polymerase specialized sigma24 family protein